MVTPENLPQDHSGEESSESIEAHSSSESPSRSDSDQTIVNVTPEKERDQPLDTDTTLTPTTPEQPRQTDPELLGATGYSPIVPTVSPVIEEETIEELEKYIDEAYRKSLTGQEIISELESEKETERARLGLERVKQGHLQQEIDFEELIGLHQDFDKLKKELQEIKEVLEFAPVEDLQFQLNNLRQLFSADPGFKREEDTASSGTTTTTSEEEEQDINMAVPGAPAAQPRWMDPLKSIPKFYGTASDVLTAQQHIEAFEDYLRAYGLYRYDGLVPGAGLAAAQQDRTREIVKRLGFSMQAEAKTWFHEQAPFANPLAPAINDYDNLVQSFLRRFNPYGRTQQEWNLEWDGIRMDPNKTTEAQWKKIQIIGGALGYNVPMQTEKLRSILAPDIYAATVQINNAQQILDVDRRMSAYKRSRAVTAPAPTQPPAVPDTTPPFMYMEDTHQPSYSIQPQQSQFHQAQQIKPEVPSKVARRLTKVESNLSTLLDAQQELCAQMKNLADSEQRGRERGRDRSRDRYQNQNRYRTQSRSPGRNNSNYRRPYTPSPGRKKNVSFKDSLTYSDNNKSPRGRSTSPGSKDRAPFSCHFCEGKGHGYRKCFKLRGMLKQFNALRKKVGHPIIPEENKEEDEDDVLRMMDNGELTYPEVLDIVRQVDAMEASNY